MASGDSKSLVDGYQAALREGLSKLDGPSMVRLRGELQVVSRWLEVHDSPEAKKVADAAVDAVSRYYQFGLEIGGFSRSTQSAQAASLFDLASVGVLALENVLTAEKRTLMRFLMSGLSEGLMFLGSRQYVSGNEAVLEAAYHTHALAVQDALWSLAMDFRNTEDLGSIREARAAIDALFAKFDDPGILLATKLVLVHQLYGLVAIIRCAKLVEALRTQV